MKVLECIIIKDVQYIKLLVGVEYMLTDLLHSKAIFLVVVENNNSPLRCHVSGNLALFARIIVSLLHGFLILQGLKICTVLG